MKSLSLTKPHALILVGVPGAGKTFFGTQFSETFSTPFVNAHALRADIFATATYDKDENSIIKTVAENQMTELLKTKQTIIVEGIADSKTDRIDVAKKIRKAGYEPLIVWVQTDQATAKSRATKGVRGTTNERLISEEIYDAMLKKFTAPHGLEKAVVISGRHTFSTQIRTVLKRLAVPREAISAPNRQAVPQTGRNIVVS